MPVTARDSGSKRSIMYTRRYKKKSTNQNKFS